MAAEKTPWKKIVSDPTYIGEADFQEGEEKILTIAKINNSETVKTAEGSSKKAVIHWKEPGAKPMILNVARAKAIQKVTGSKYLEDWPGHQVQLYIQDGIKAFGETVSAVRVRPYKPRPQQPSKDAPICADCGKPITAVRNGTVEQIVNYTTAHYGVCLCADCDQRRRAAQKPTETPQDAPEPETGRDTPPPQETQQGANTGEMEPL